MPEDDKFRSDVLVALAKIDSHMEAQTAISLRHDDDICALKITVNGNGKPGLAEKVRNIYWYGGFVMTGIFTLLQIFGNDVRQFFHKG
jgi:hypothetical protein